MKVYIGIDDAGRGPIIGPMVLAGVLADEKQIEQLKLLGVRDSKLISPKRREFLFSKIKKIAADCKIIKTSASEIDDKIAKKINLNWIEARKAAKIINNLVKDLKSKVEVIVDCPSPNTHAWHNYLMEYVDKPAKIKLRCEHKADLNYVVVGAASILAKVTRDKEVEKIKKEYGIECGSGYPADPLCIKFLKTNKAKELAKLGFIRKSWATWKNVEKKKSQKKLGEFDT